MLAAVPHSPVATPSTESGRAPELGVGPVTLPRYLERTNIVTRRGMEMTVAEFDRWVEPLSESVPRAIAANLATLLRTERIVVFPWSNTASIEHQVVIDAIRFAADPRVHNAGTMSWRASDHDSDSSTSTSDRGTGLSRPARA